MTKHITDIEYQEAVKYIIDAIKNNKKKLDNTPSDVVVVFPLYKTKEPHIE